MKRTTVAVLAPVAILLCAAFASPFSVYTSKEGRFSIKVPGIPKVETTTESTAAGPIPTTMYTLDGGNYAFAFGFADMPAASMKNANPDKVLDGAREGAVAKMNGKLTSTKNIKIGAWPGRDFTVTGVGGGTLAAMRVYLVGNRLYQTVVAYAPGAITAADVATYLDSFQLTK